MQNTWIMVICWHMIIGRNNVDFLKIYVYTFIFFLNFNIFIFKEQIIYLATVRPEGRPSLVQIMACCLFGTKPLFEPMLVYCPLETIDTKKQISMKFHLTFKSFLSWKCIRKCCWQNGVHLSKTVSFKKMHLKMSSAKWWLFNQASIS